VRAILANGSEHLKLADPARFVELEVGSVVAGERLELCLLGRFARRERRAKRADELFDRRCQMRRLRVRLERGDMIRTISEQVLAGPGLGGDGHDFDPSRSCFGEKRGGGWWL
jgi:hypothetical protein